MSNIDNIKNKEVHYQINTSTDTLENDGKVNIIIPPYEDNVNSLYIGKEHIASGYGFNETTYNKLNEIIENTNLQKVLDGELYVDIQLPDDSGSTINDVEYEESEAYLHGDRIYIDSEGKIHTQPLTEIGSYDIDIYNVEIKVKHTNINGNVDNTDPVIKDGKINYSIFDSAEIRTIKFNYIINKNSNISILGLILSNDNEISKTNNGIRQNSPKNDYLINVNELNNDDLFTIITEKSDNSFGTELGIEHTVTIKIKNDALDRFNINSYKYLYLYFADSRGTNIKYIYKQICNAETYYPLFGNITGELSGNNQEIKLTEDNYYIVDMNKSNYNAVNHYIFIPKIFENKKLSIILQSSNIACNFELLNNTTYKGIIYNIYKSYNKYNNKLTWLVKLW